MKKRFTLMTAVFALLAFLAIPMGMKGQTTVTFTAGTDTGETSVTKDGITVSMSTMSRTDNYRCYANTAMTVASTIGDITSIDLTCTASGTDSYGPGKFSLTDGYTGSYTYSGYVGSWNGSAEEVSLSASSQVRMSKIVVTVGGSAPTSYIVTYDCNGGTSDCPVSEDEVEANSTIILADAPSREGFTFAGWNDGNTTYEAGYDEYVVNGNVTFTAQWTEIVSGDEQWVLTSLADLTENDVFVIVGNNGSTFAMSNDKGTTNAPTAVAVTVANNLITSAVTSNIKWTISGNATDGYTFYPNGTTETWLYCTNTNNGVRVGDNTGNTFTLHDSGYLKHGTTSRYVGIYNSQDWRCYTDYNTNNIKDQTFAFYKKVTGEVIPPSITAENVSIEYDATSGTIEYTINNPVDGGSLTANTESDWITLGTTIGEAVPFTCTANTEGTQRTASITLTYTFNRETVTKEVTVTQGAAPVTYTTIPALFAAATSTETNIFVTFNNWVVSGVSTNGKNVFVTDNNGNGFVIYGNEDMSNTYATGNVLSGTAVSCTLKKSNGYAQLLNVNATDLTITDGGTVSVANIALADLAGVNTGALVHYENMTCNINNNRYYLTDGTTTIQLYNSLYAFGALENGETYNITGIYQQYNSTKEILPRSADDIEEVEVPTEEYTLTVSDPENITFTVGYGTDGVLTNGENASIENGTEITVTLSLADGYALNSITVVGEEEGQTVTISETSTAGVYTFNMPAFNATLSASAMAATTATYSLATTIESGKTYIIVGQANGDYYAMGNDKGNNRYAYEITLDGTTATANIASVGVHEFTISSLGEGFFSICDAIEPGYLYAASNSNNHLKTEATLDENHNGDWKITFNAEGGSANVVASQSSNRNVMQFNNSSILFACYATASQHPVFLYVKEDTAPETYTLEIKGYEAGSDDGYYLIASPVNVNPAEVQDMTEGEFDLYYFDESQDLEWINYKGENGSFNLEPGKGYLYAKKATTEGEVFSFELSGTPYDGTPITLAKVGNGEFQGWNLVGNPFADTAYINRDFYVMKEDGSEIITGEGNKIAPMQGFFVIAEQDGEELAISTEAPSNTGSKIVVNVTQNRGNVIDRAIVRFGEGRQLPKFMMNPGNTKLFIAQADNEYAVVRSANEGEMPVSFKAAENGYYTLNIKAEDTEMGYLHLIDNMTGADVDLLSTPNYTFQANTTDYANRFCLVYAATTSINESASDDFAFFNGNEWVINSDGEATLQVIDMTGRVLSSQTVNGNTNLKLNQANGVYLLRLLQNNTVKNQKIVKE